MRRELRSRIMQIRGVSCHDADGGEGVVGGSNEETRDGGESPAGHATAPKRGIHSRRGGFDWDIRT